MRVLIAIPTYENVSTECYEALWTLRDYMNERHPDVELDLTFVKGHGVQRARNDIALKAIEKNYDYLFTVDSDVVVPENALQLLLQANPQVVLAPYVNRWRDDDASVLYYDNGETSCSNNNLLRNKQILDMPKGRIKLLGGGLGCALIDVKVFGHIDYPYFVWREWMDGDGKRLELSEDIGFCMACRDKNIKVEADTRVICKHVTRRVE
jgi:hypothetical protein